MEVGDGPLGPVLVDEPKPNAQDDDAQDDRGIGLVAQQDRDHGGCGEQEQERIHELAAQHARRASDVAAQGVRANERQPA
jgi:hypothetical protein